jgi:hypothetical protein
MATPDSSGVERRRVRLDGNRPRTHPKHSGRKVGDVLDPCHVHGMAGPRLTLASMDKRSR